jgi:large subunit ribosomal protein L9
MDFQRPGRSSPGGRMIGSDKRRDAEVKLILKEVVPNLGKPGDIVDVAEGYGRNYLLPRGLGVKASTTNVKELDHQKRLVQSREENLKAEARELAKRLEALSCTVARKVGEEEKLFGSVTNRDLAELLKAEGVPVDHRWVQLEEPIKKLGAYTIPVKLHPEVVAQVKLQVVPE